MSFSSFPFWSTSDINTLSSYKCIRLWKIGHSFEPHRLDNCISQAGAQHENHTWRHEGVGKSPESGSGPSRSCRHVVEIAVCLEMEKPGVRLLAVYMQEALQTRECRPQSASCGWMLIWAAGPALLAPALPLLPVFTAHRIESGHLAQIEHHAFSGCSPAYPDHTDRLYHITPSRLCPLLPLPWNLPSVFFLWTITHPPPLQSSRPLLMVPPWQNWPFPVAGTHLTLPRSPASGFCFFEAWQFLHRHLWKWQGVRSPVIWGWLCH